MTTPAPSERASRSARGTGRPAVLDTVAKLNVLLGGDARATDPTTVNAADANDAETAEASRRVIQRMAMRVGDLGFLFPVDVGREVVAPPTVSRIPNTPSWLRGLANVRGSLVPVVDAAAVLGIARTVGTPSYLLIFGQGDNAIGLTIDGLPRLLDIDVGAVVGDPPAVPTPLEPCVGTAYEHAGRVWFDLDLDAWFDILAREVALAGGANPPTARPAKSN